MSSSRWLARLIVPVMAGAALVAGAPSAAASPLDDAYLAQLRGVGFTWPPEHDPSLIGMGWLICDDLGWGWTYDQIADQVHATLDARGVSYGQVQAMVGIAHSTYCPGQQCWGGAC
jgi:hypothetical protein